MSAYAGALGDRTKEMWQVLGGLRKERQRKVRLTFSTSSHTPVVFSGCLQLDFFVRWELYEIPTSG